MPRCCVVCACEVESDDDSSNYHFPKNLEEARIWQKSLNADDVSLDVLQKTFCVCAEHLPEFSEQLESQPAVRSGGGGERCGRLPKPGPISVLLIPGAMLPNYEQESQVGCSRVIRNINCPESMKSVPDCEPRRTRSFTCANNNHNNDICVMERHFKKQNYLDEEPEFTILRSPTPPIDNFCNCDEDPTDVLILGNPSQKKLKQNSPCTDQKRDENVCDEEQIDDCYCNTESPCASETKSSICCNESELSTEARWNGKSQVHCCPSLPNQQKQEFKNRQPCPSQQKFPNQPSCLKQLQHTGQQHCPSQPHCSNHHHQHQCLNKQHQRQSFQPCLRAQQSKRQNQQQQQCPNHVPVEPCACEQKTREELLCIIDKQSKRIVEQEVQLVCKEEKCTHQMQRIAHLENELERYMMIHNNLFGRIDALHKDFSKVVQPKLNRNNK